jgi:hypothetical protein
VRKVVFGRQFNRNFGGIYNSGSQIIDKSSGVVNLRKEVVFVDGVVNCYTSSIGAGDAKIKREKCEQRCLL